MCYHLQQKAAHSRQRHQCNKRVEQYHTSQPWIMQASLIGTLILQRTSKPPWQQAGTGKPSTWIHHQCNQPHWIKVGAWNTQWQQQHVVCTHTFKREADRESDLQAALKIKNTLDRQCLLKYWRNRQRQAHDHVPIPINSPRLQQKQTHLMNTRHLW